MGDATTMENAVNCGFFLPGRGAAGDGAAANELGDLTHCVSPYCIELTAITTL
jgi:hypothetical protein